MPTAKGSLTGNKYHRINYSKVKTSGDRSEQFQACD